MSKDVNALAREKGQAYTETRFDLVMVIKTL